MTEAAPDVATGVGPVVARVADGHSGGLAITAGMPDDLPPVAVAAASLETALVTLVENSRQAGATRITITAERQDASVCLCVADDGPGVPRADAERLFEPFFTTRRATGGTGLGLTIARSLLAAAGGEITLVDREEGTTFEIRLPIAPSG